MTTTTTKERGIPFSPAMVRALLAGRKTQTRRGVKRGQVLRILPGSDLSREERKRINAEPFDWDRNNPAHPSMEELLTCCPYGVPGDRLWVRETWYFDIDPYGPIPKEKPADRLMDNLYYRADGECCEQIPECQCYDTGPTQWRPSIHMPRWASRLTLEVVSVRVERVQDISEADAIAEGVERANGTTGRDDPAGAHWKNYSSSRRGGVDWPVFHNARTSFLSLWDSINGAGSWAANPWVWVIEFRRVQP